MITIDFNSFWKEDNLLKEETIEFVRTNIGEPDKITLWKEIKEDLDSNYSIFFNYKDFHLHGILAIGNPLNRLSITGEDTEYLTRNKVSKVLNVTLINLDDKEMIAEFILNQSISTIEDDYNVNDDEGDWISDLVTDLIEHIYGYDIFDYEGECEIEANYFHRNLTMGYDYHAYSQNIIDSLI